MGLHGERGQGMQAGIDICIDALDDRLVRHSLGSVLEDRQDLLLAFLAMRDIFGQFLLRSGNHLAVSWNNAHDIQVLDALERLEVIVQVALGWRRDDNRAMAGDQVACEEDALLLQPEAEMIEAMTWRVERAQG